MTPMVEISVNLATHNRSPYLESCLVSLCEQRIAPERYEICVVANACTDNTPDVVAAVAARYPRHRLFMVDEPVAGLSRARNRGIAATKAPLIAHIDDDATAAANWLEVFLTGFAGLKEDVAAIGGEINPVWQAPPPEWLEPRMKGVLSAASNMGSLARFIMPHENIFEGNCCYRRAALLSVGMYPVQLGRVGDLLLSGEGAVNSLLRFKGWKLFFDPAALINHTIHTDRLAPMWFRKRFFWQGVSDYAVHLYCAGNGLSTVNSLTLDLPLQETDWAFLAQDTPQGLDASMSRFENLGFVLAMSSIITVDHND